MQDKNNSAIDKVESITGESKKTTSRNTSAVKPSKTGKNTKKSDAKKASKNKLTRAERKQERQKAKALKKEKRLEAERKKEEERRQKREQLAIVKMEKKAEKEKRRDLIKAEKEKRKAELKSQKSKIREERKSRRAKAKDDRKASRHGYGGWLAAVIALGCSVIIMTGIIGTMFFLGSPINNNNGLNSVYEQSFYDLVGYVQNMDVKLSKLMVSNSQEEQQKLLGELSVDSNLAVSSLTDMPVSDESRYYTTKLLNQVGDYSVYLSHKLIDGENLTEEDYENLNSLYTINSSLKKELTTLAGGIDKDYKFKSLLKKDKSNIITDKFNELENMAMDYPKMIYDGPFSDGLETRVAKGLEGKDELNKDEAEQKLKEYFSEYDLGDIKYVGDTTGRYFECFNFEARGGDGVGLYAQISKKGGYLMSFNYYKVCENGEREIEECIDIAQEFLGKIGIQNVTPVWQTADGRTATINFAYSSEGVIYYPDLIKVNVCMERGVVNGYEATGYYLNHTDRTPPEEQITENEAMENISSNMEVDSVRLAVIPIGNSDEKLSYEFSGRYDGGLYYVYIDAETGKELQIFRVVETTEGMLIV